MSFSADWLALRAPADDRARSAELMALAAARVDAPVSVCDLGAGTGATLRALAGHLPRPQQWLLVDADADLLAEAARRAAAAPLPDVAVETLCADILATPTPWPVAPSLVSASALFDLTSAAWIARFAEACAADGVGLLSMLTFDGVLEAFPAHPYDDAMREAFNTHQRGDKGFGPAAGPDAPAALAKAFGAHGYAVSTRSTPWDLRAGRDDALMRELLRGWAGAAAELRQADKAAVAAWCEARIAGTDRLVVGHQDQLFVPA